MDEQWYPEASQEQKDAIEEAERKIVASVPVIQDVLDWLDKRIADYEKTTTISGIDPSTDAEDIKAAVLLSQALINDYKERRDNFTTTFAKYLKDDADVA